MRASLIVLSFGVACMVTPAWAEGTPARKPGLWEMTAGAANTPAQVIKYCLDPATDAALQKSAQADSDAHCSTQDIRHDGNVVTTNAVCKYGDTEVVGLAVYSISGETATRIEMKNRYSPPLKGQSETTKTWKWLGSCPTDMQPGDAIMNGIKMNIITHQIKGYEGKTP